MTHINPTICVETPSHSADIQVLHENVFGPGRFARTAFRIREGCEVDPRYCFVAMLDGCLAGSVRVTPIAVGSAKGFLLGPLCVQKERQKSGLGKALVRQVVERVAASDNLPVFLVGDQPYYGQLGFERAPNGVKMPGPVDYNRLLVWWPKGVEVNAPQYQGVIRCGC